MYSKGIAYLLWAVGGFGVLGLHRFYLGKPLSGILWACTGGLVGIGALVDLFTLGRQVDDANMRILLGGQLNQNMMNNAMAGNYMRNVTDGRTRTVPSAANTEHAILMLAKMNHGIVTPNQAALEAHIKIDDAKKKLDDMSKAGHTEMRVRKNGSIVYTFPEFMDTQGEADLEGF
jgi:TM2 domain-containing membrane protein YozV